MAIPRNAANIAPATGAIAERIRGVFDTLEGAIGNVHNYMDLALAVQNQLQEPQIRAQSPTRKVKESGELFLESQVRNHAIKVFELDRPPADWPVPSLRVANAINEGRVIGDATGPTKENKVVDWDCPKPYLSVWLDGTATWFSDDFLVEANRGTYQVGFGVDPTLQPDRLEEAKKEKVRKIFITFILGKKRWRNEQLHDTSARRRDMRHNSRKKGVHDIRLRWAHESGCPDSVAEAIELAGPGTVSDDESGHEEPEYGEKIYTAKDVPNRHPAITRVYHALDAHGVAYNYRRSSSFRTRRRASRINPIRPMALGPGLPRGAYDPDWFDSLPNWDKRRFEKKFKGRSIDIDVLNAYAEELESRMVVN